MHSWYSHHSFYFILFYISFYISTYHISQVFTTSFSIIWRKVFVKNAPFLTDSLKLLYITNILITITLEVKITIRQANPFFYLLFELLSVGLFHLCISKDLQNSISSVPHLHYVAIPKDLQNSVSSVPHLHYVLIQKIFKTQFQVSPICNMF